MLAKSVSSLPARRRNKNIALFCLVFVVLFCVWSVVSELVLATPANRDTENRIPRSTPLIRFIREHCCYHPFCNFQVDEATTPPDATAKRNEQLIESSDTGPVCKVNFSYLCDKRCLFALSTSKFARVEQSEVEAYRAAQSAVLAESERDLLFHVYWDPRGGPALNEHIRLSLYSILATQRNPNSPYNTRGGGAGNGRRKRDASNESASEGGSEDTYNLPNGKAILRLWTPQGIAPSAFLTDRVLQQAHKRGRLIIAELDEAGEIAKAREHVRLSFLSVQRLKQRVLDLVFFRGNVVGFTDLLRYLLTFNYGGVYLDADVMMLRDITPLLNNEFAYQWSFLCDYNSAITYVRKGSDIARLFLERSEFEYRLLHPFRLRGMCDSDSHCRENYLVYPPAFFDPLWVGHDYHHDPLFAPSGSAPPGKIDGRGITLVGDETGVGPDRPFDFLYFFQKRTPAMQRLADSLRYPYAYHWHNEWKATFEAGSIALEYLSRFEGVLLESAHF